MIDDVKDYRKQMREINTIVNTLKNSLQVLDDRMITSLQRGSNEMVQSSYPVFDEWWVKNVEVTNDESIVSSTELWFHFKQENKNIIKEFEITAEKFKQFIKSKVPISCLIIKSKNLNSALEIRGIKFTSGEKNEINISTSKIEDAETEVEGVENTQEKKKKIIKKSK
jgi:hypothetical protein